MQESSSDRDGASLPKPAALAFGLVGLWALTIAYPLFENLTSGPDGVIHLDWVDIIFLIALVLLVPPLIMTGLIVGLRRLLSARAAIWPLGLLIGLLVSLLLWQYIQPPSLLPSILLVLLGLSIGYLVARTQFFRAFFIFFGLATPIILVTFLASPYVSSELAPTGESKPLVKSVKKQGSEGPVVLIVFDEFPLSAMTHSRRAIDTRLFPNFARLARGSTWYPKMVSSGIQTLKILLSLLTGNRPNMSRASAPSMKNHPNNLCEIMRELGWNVSTSETITALCDRQFSRVRRLTSAIVAGIASGVVPSWIRKPWSAILDDLGRVLFLNTERKERATGFIDELKPKTQRFFFLHSMMPHTPWDLNEVGNFYRSNEADPTPPDLGSAPTVPQQAAYQEFQVTAAYADYLVGRLIKKLQAEGEWRKTMLVVTADHGRAILGRDPGRGPTSQNAAQVLEVPLFIKYPGQVKGRIDERVARSEDLVPTIMNELGITLTQAVGGKDLTSSNRPRRLKQVKVAGETELIKFSWSELARSRSNIQRMRNDTLRQRSRYAFGGYNWILGKKLALSRREIKARGRLVASLDPTVVERGLDAKGNLLNTIINKRDVIGKRLQLYLRRNRLSFRMSDEERGDYSADDRLESFFSVPAANTAGFEAEVLGPGLYSGAPVAVAYGREILSTARVFKASNGKLVVSTVLPADGSKQRQRGESFKVFRLPPR